MTLYKTDQKRCYEYLDPLFYASSTSSLLPSPRHSTSSSLVATHCHYKLLAMPASLMHAFCRLLAAILPKVLLPLPSRVSLDRMMRFSLASTRLEQECRAQAGW